MDIKIVSKNRKAGHNYFLLDRYEAGIVLQGSEIKSLRNGQMSISEAFVRIENNEAWLVDAHISPYDHSGRFNHDPTRPRKLLLHKSEIRHLWDEIRKKGVTLIPTIAYLKGGKAKVEIAVAKGKKLYDKREIIAKRDLQRQIEREFRGRE
jgi:SsrA-binding protein